MADIEKCKHDQRNVIITAKKEINARQCFQYLRKNMRKYPDGSTFLIITGHHHDGLDESKKAKIGRSDHLLEETIDLEWLDVNKRLGRDCKKNKCGDCENCVWQNKKFKMNTINFKTKDVSGKGPYKPCPASLDKLISQFNFLRTFDEPVVFVYFSCWSHYSPINTFLCARGIYAVLTLKKERSDLTIERVFKLDEEQEEYLKMVVDDPMIGGQLRTKDLIIAGKYNFI